MVLTVLGRLGTSSHKHAKDARVALAEDAPNCCIGNGHFTIKPWSVTISCT